jgi:hypothetical protein
MILEKDYVKLSNRIFTRYQNIDTRLFQYFDWNFLFDIIDITRNQTELGGPHGPSGVRRNDTEVRGLRGPRRKQVKE